MRNLLFLPLALFVTVVSATEIDPKIADFCMMATDFAGCVQTMSSGLPPKQKQDAEQGLRTWTRATGVTVRMRTASLVAMKSSDGDYGTHIKWVYGRTARDNDGYQKEVQANCKEFTADWNMDGQGWRSVKDPEQYRRNTDEYEPTIEAKAVMDEFCPQMQRLVEEAKLRDAAAAK